MTDFCPEGYTDTTSIVDSSLGNHRRATPLLLIAKSLDADARILAKHYGHLASSYIVNAIPDAPKFGFTPNASVVPLRG